MEQMIRFDQALKIVLENTPLLESERGDFLHCAGRVLAEDIRADIAMPPFDKSAVDGFACRKVDVGSELQIIETIAAGKSPEKSIIYGTCSRIMTGAMLPPGADFVIMVEDTKKSGQECIIAKTSAPGPNICYFGEEVKENEIVLTRGTIISARHIAVLAAMGATTPLLAVRPRISILSTGDELVEPDKKPGPSQIRNSNAYQLLAQASLCGLEAQYAGIAMDSIDDGLNKLNTRLDQSDIVLITGGVSMGEYDNIPEVMIRCGIDIKFKKIAIQPGRPTVFGTKDNKLIFGLPGNPVSSFVLFEMLVKQAIYKMMGADYKPPIIRVTAGEDIPLKHSDRFSVIPVKVSSEGTASRIRYKGSAHIHALTSADGLLLIPEGVTKLNKGDQADVRPI